MIIVMSVAAAAALVVVAYAKLREHEPEAATAGKGLTEPPPRQGPLGRVVDRQPLVSRQDGRISSGASATYSPKRPHHVKGNTKCT